MQSLDSLQTQIYIPTSGLDSLTNDCLRFTMHFIQLIQQSSQHIYHSALPLSPKSSMFSSMSLPGQTRISEFYGHPDHWGSVVRTIRTIPGGFTCMTTIGRGSTAIIAAACHDGTVHVYDSVTDVLRLSLRPELPIQEITGPPDGSVLVCTHTAPPSVTLWDIQTGGLVKTFILKEEAKRTTVSPKGRYLACETSKNTVSVWEMASKTQYPAPLEQFKGHAPCWLAPEELIIIEDRWSVCIRNVFTKGPPVHKFDVLHPAHSAVYSEVFDRLVIVSPYGYSFTIFDVKTGTSSTFHTSGKRLSFFAFSQTIKQLVCGGEGPGLETVDMSTGCRMRFDLPVTTTSVSTLSNGTIVANVRGSGIQLLRLDQEDVSPRQPTPLLTAYPLDEGRIIAIVPTTNDCVILLETATMSPVLSVTTHHTVVLCASLKHQVTVRCSSVGKNKRLQMWGFSHQHPRWTVAMNDLPSASGISPACTMIVTLHSGDPQSFVRIWNGYSGSLLVSTTVDNHPAPRPPNITFDSETRFYFYHGTHREPYSFNATSRTSNHTTYSITRRAKQSSEGQAWGERYCLDDGREWVSCGSQRICWIPPEYIGSARVIHCWAGSSLFMVGQDGTSKKITFQEL